MKLPALDASVGEPQQRDLAVAIASLGRLEVALGHGHFSAGKYYSL
jgi:hypothetical protein